MKVVCNNRPFRNSIVIGDYFEKLYLKNQENLGEIYAFLHRYNLPNLNQVSRNTLTGLSLSTKEDFLNSKAWAK